MVLVAIYAVGPEIPLQAMGAGHVVFHLDLVALTAQFMDDVGVGQAHEIHFEVVRFVLHYGGGVPAVTILAVDVRGTVGAPLPFGHRQAHVLVVQSGMAADAIVGCRRLLRFR